MSRYRRRWSGNHGSDRGNDRGWGGRGEGELSVTDRSGRHIRPRDVGNGQSLVREDDIRPPQSICLYDGAR